MNLRTCVARSGQFIHGIHSPCFRAENFREKDYISSLGIFEDGQPLENHANFPCDTVEEPHADQIFEVANPFPFRGTTYIIKRFADRIAENPSGIALPERAPVSLCDTLGKWLGENDLPADKLDTFFHALPDPLKLALAANSTDPEDLIRMTRSCCEFVCDPAGKYPTGLVYTREAGGKVRAKIKNHPLFEALANNPFLPDDYKKIMVLRPGVQGDSEIVGEWPDEDSHVFEYLRRNSYIPWGHYAANMAHDAIRYRTRELGSADMRGMRHLYYQRTYVRLAEHLDMSVPARRRRLSAEELEELRKRVCHRLLSDRKQSGLKFNSTLWGWNFGFDYTPSGYRLHGSHQQVHQQFALIPASVSNPHSAEDIPAYGCGDLIHSFIREYRGQTGKNFFDNYIKAVRNNRRMDDDMEKNSSLIVREDDQVMLFVPKAQTSQWELQMMTLNPVGNILEADTAVRAALDRAMLTAIKVLGAMGARMITTIEYPKRFDSPDADQRLLYSFLPKLPWSPGAFTEAQLRWISGHYPEDFAAACRSRLSDAEAPNPDDP